MVLPRSRVSRGHAVRHEQGRKKAAFCSDPYGRPGHAYFGDLDSLREQLDAHSCRLRDGVQWSVPARAELVGHRFQSQFRSEEHTSELQSLMRISYAVYGLK